MTYLRNGWYCAAWASEIGRSPLARTILDDPVLLYRKEDGGVAAMSDRCPHRFAPLHQGKLIGDTIACPYHGLEFGPDGACRHNPHGDGKIPAGAALKAYPVVERQHVIWIWMGDPAKADPAEIPDHPELDEAAGWTTVTGHLNVSAHFSLVIDNLLDLTHAGYLHSDSVSVDASLKMPDVQCSVEPDGIYSRFLTGDVPPPKPFRPYWPDARCDYHRLSRWTAPSIVRTTIGVSQPGGLLSDGIVFQGYHLLTPETERTTHYLWSASRQFAAGDANYDAALRGLVEQAFRNEDEPMIAACQRYMGTTDLFSLKPALLTTDRASVLAYRALRRLIQERDETV